LGFAHKSGALVVATLLGAALAGCQSSEPPVPVAAATPGVSADALIGKWGLAAYHRDTDRARTMKEASAQCNKPYVITQGPSGGVMMYLADQATPQELVLKPGSDGKTYLGPPGPAPTADDREVLDVDPNSFTTIWVDPDNSSRYGTMVYERCGAKKA
jgi:hypothetical protein